MANNVLEYNIAIPEEAADGWNSILQAHFQARLESEEDSIRNDKLLSKYEIFIQ